MDSQGNALHPVIITLALLTAGWLATFLTATAIKKPDPMVAGTAMLLWIAFVALIWKQWVRKPVPWLGRTAALVGLAMLSVTVYGWTQQTDVFIEYRRNCPPRTGTFWKLVIVWLGGAGAIGYTLLGSVMDGLVMRRLQAQHRALRLLWWVAIASWSAACTYVFVRNINSEVALRSFKTLGLGVGKGLLVFSLVVGAIAAVVWLLTIPSRKREKQAQADYLAISEERKREMLAMAERHARGVEHCLYYRETDAADWDVRKPHIGGSVLMPAGERWPTSADGEPGLFLLQLPLPAVLPAPWPGRVLALWLSTSAFDVQVRSYAGIDGLVEVPPVSPRNAQYSLVPKRAFVPPLALPVPRTDDDEAEEDEFCAWLLQDCAELRDALAAVTEQPDAVLVKLLANDVRANSLESGTGLWVGGEPQLIQGPHEPACEICGQAMRFLFSTGDVTEEMAFGDVGVAYVYGCDAHPEHCQTFVDCH